MKTEVNTISFSRYNEPLSHLDVLADRIELARRIIPNVKLVTNTNGDFLDSLQFDIDELTIMDYDCKGVEYWIKKLSELGAFVTLIAHSELRAEFENMLIRVELNWPLRENIMEDRGGILKSKDLKWKNDLDIRTRPCFEPIYFIGIDYTGDVVPCCHIRGDSNIHNGYVMGNLYDNDIHTILESKKRTSFIIDCIVSDFIGPCITCQKDVGRYTSINGGIYS
jgi:hypothetical protein